MTTIEAICNQALDIIGYPKHIGNIYEGTKASRIALDAWGETRDALLAATQPDFARTDRVLVLLRQAPDGYLAPPDWSVAYPPIPWLYEYATPDGCITPLYIKPQPQYYLPVWRPRSSSFRTNNDVTGAYTILSNIKSPAILTYIRQVLDPDVWTEEYTETLIHALAKKFQVALGKPMPQQPQQQQERRDANAA